MRIGSILVVSDLSAAENLAVRRACQLAGAHQATLKLMDLPAGNANKLPRIADEARGVDLVVLPHRHERSTAAFFRGRPVLGLLRRLDVPVLVVRRPQRAHYAKVLVAVDFTPQSRALARIAADLDPLARLELFHAVGTADEARLRSAEATEEAVRSFRAKRRRRAQKDMAAFQESFVVHRHRMRTALGRGEAGRQTVLRQERTGADLVVVGKKRRSAWEDFLCGSVAHRVLSWGSSDVLIVPDAHAGVQEPITPERIGLPGAWAAMALAAGRGAP